MAKIRVLIVDDHAAVRRGLAQALRDEPGIEVVAEAPDGGSAIRLARQLRPDMILMDVVMPELNGIEATRRITQDDPQIRVIGFSVHDCPIYATRMIEAGASAYMLKDCDMEELVREMHAACEESIGYTSQAWGAGSGRSKRPVAAGSR